MQCPKCQTENADSARFCSRCHTPLRYECPACKNIQTRGGKCEKCGVDFAKYTAMLAFKAEQDTRRAREASRNRSGWIKQILLLPITGGISLVRFLLGRLKGE
jgi:hypothetical protein